MKLIPDRPVDTKSKAERKIFYALRESFNTNHNIVAFHSFYLTKHEKKRVGEADFLILCEHGIFVLEVKGGGISHVDGQWFTTNQQGQYHIQDPFRQANDAMFSVEKKIKNEPQFSNLRFTTGYGVVFSDAEWHQHGAEWDREIICDSRNLRHFEKWLNNLFKYWLNKPNNNWSIENDKIKQLKTFLRPDFEMVELLYDKLSDTEENSVKLTEDQYLYIDIAMDNDRVLCSGGAGTGKTFLAAELARRKGEEDKNILLVCKSLWLKNYLSMRIINDSVIVSTIEGVPQALRRAGLDTFDVLIVDEGQDLFNFEDIQILDDNLKDGLENGEWYIFHDVNNQSNLVCESNLEVLEYLKSLNNPAKIPLKTNCRNTLNILNKVQTSLQLDMGNKGTGDGPDVFEVPLPKEQIIKALSNKISELFKFDVPSGAITLLSPYPFEKSIASELPSKIRNTITILDDYSARNFPLDRMTFAEIKHFKGMENEVIILVDLPPPSILNETSDKASHYVGMSRARGLLCAFWEEQ